MTGRVGDYELVRRIGSGGMAEVWMGRRQGVGGATKSVAVKFIIPSKTNSERHREMFLSEARLSMMLSHSNVIQVFDAGEDAGRLYMVMEWVDGMNLAQLLAHMRAQGVKPSLSLAGYVIGEVLKGLAYAHNLYHEGRQITIVHRDISPQNVLVSVSGEVKLLDFGVARLAQEETSGVHIKGKLRYMAPEHLGGSSKAPTVDVYGAGAILHELIEGTKYREGADEMQLYNQILGGQTPDLTRVDTPAALAQLRGAMLEPDETTRIPSATAALEMLERWSGYRSAAGELSRVVRGYMGVQTPRSGIHMRPPLPSARPLSDSTPPTAATHTRQGPSTGTTAPEMSSSMPSAGTDPSLAVPPGTAAHGSEPIVVRKKGTSALLLGVGAGLLVAVGALGVVLALRPDAESEPVANAEVAPPELDADEAAPTPDLGQAQPPDPAEVAAPLEVGEPAVEVAPKLDVGAAAEQPDETEALDESEEEPQAEDAPARPRRRARRRPSRGASPKPAPAPEKAKPKVKVSLKLKKPLTVAYVKIDGGRELVLEPMKRIELTLGKHSVMWRPSRDQPFVQGGTITLTEGGGRTIRIVSPAGARVEK